MRLIARVPSRNNPEAPKKKENQLFLRKIKRMKMKESQETMNRHKDPSLKNLT